MGNLESNILVAPQGAQLTMERLLILVFSLKRADRQDFTEIAQEVQRLSPRTAIYIATPHDRYDDVPARWRELPTLTVGMGVNLGRFLPLKGALVHARAIPKLDQFARFRSTGITTPETERFKPGHTYDEARWGEFVILKPLSLGMTSSGSGVRLMRTRRLANIQGPAELASIVGSNAPVLVQSFIDTGENPTSWRILTLFGRPLFSMKFWSPLKRPSLTSDDPAIESAIVETKHPELKKKFGMEELRELTFRQDILDFASQVAKAFPNIPVQGIDIVEDLPTRTLHVLEINGGGNVWHISSPRSASTRKAGLTREKRIAQLGAWRIAAEGLIDATNRLAS